MYIYVTVTQLRWTPHSEEMTDSLLNSNTISTEANIVTINQVIQ